MNKVDELLMRLKTHKQEAIDCLIASRASYEPTLDGVADILERSYDVDTSIYELLFHREQPTFLSARLLDNQEQVYVIIRSSNGYVMVAFRGTFTLQDAIQDMKLTTVPFLCGKGRAHVGFVSRAQSMPIELFMRLARAGEKLIFTGHSLGGAVASLTALRVLEAISQAEAEGGKGEGEALISRERVLCVTFGTAPFANRELAMHINSHYRDRFYHMVSKHDFVPRAHNILPRLFFPLANHVRESRHVQAAQRLLGSASFLKARKRVERIFFPTAAVAVAAAAAASDSASASATGAGFLGFLRGCMANDKDSLFYGLCGYVLLFDPDARDAESIVEVGCMENMTPGFCAQGKSALQVLFEHGLGNHYACIVQGLFDQAGQPRAQLQPRTQSINRSAYNSITKSIMPFLSDPTSAMLFGVARFLLMMVNNDVPAAAATAAAAVVSASTKTTIAK